MFIKIKKIKLMIIVIVLLIICTSIGVFKHRQSVLTAATIDGRVAIDNYNKLYVNCYGKGTPTVIFESGLGCTNLDWKIVQNQISKNTRTFSYDRAGLGKSDKIRVQRSSLDQVHELHTLLNNANVKGPYIIVAHSIGGYNARLFAGTYPNEVAGIVFVDSSHENQLDFLKNSTAQVYKEISATSEGAEQTLDEQIISANQVKEIRKKDSLRNTPIIVLTADKNIKPSQDKYEEIMKRMVDQEKDIASLSNKSKFIFVKDSGHYIQKDKPQVVIDSIQELIATVRK